MNTKRIAGFPVLVFIFTVFSGFSQEKPDMKERIAELNYSDPLIEALELRETDSFLPVMKAPAIASHATLFVGGGMTGVTVDLGIPDEDPADYGLAEEKADSLSDLFHQVSHLNGGEGGIEPFIAAFGAGPFDGLLNIIRRENAEYHRFACFQPDMRNTFCHFSCNIIKMGCSSPDYGAKTNHGIVLLVPGKLFCQ
jgi:hypothetical protein